MSEKTSEILDRLRSDVIKIKMAADKERLLAEEELKNNNKFQNEVDTLKIDKIRYELEEVKSKLARDTDTHDLRKQYVPRLYWLIFGWLCVVVAFTFMSSCSSDSLNNPDCQINCARFKIADNVLIAFITSTTFAVLGLFHFVAKWLYPSGETKPEKEKNEKDKKEG